MGIVKEIVPQAERVVLDCYRAMNPEAKTAFRELGAQMAKKAVPAAAAAPAADVTPQRVMVPVDEEALIQLKIHVERSARALRALQSLVNWGGSVRAQEVCFRRGDLDALLNPVVVDAATALEHMSGVYRVRVS